MFVSVNDPLTRDVNETLRSETKTFHFRFDTRPRLRPSKIFSKPRGDQDLQFRVGDRDRDVQGRDRDIFRDLTHK